MYIKHIFSNILEGENIMKVLKRICLRCLFLLLFTSLILRAKGIKQSLFTIISSDNYPILPYIIILVIIVAISSFYRKHY